MIIVQNEHVISTYLEEPKTLISIFKGRADVDLALDHLKKSVDFYNNYTVKGAIADISQVFGSFVKIMGFMEEVYYPAAKKSGMQSQAFVISKDLINHHLGLKLKNIATLFDIKSGTFTNYNSAEEWLMKNLN